MSFIRTSSLQITLNKDSLEDNYMILSTQMQQFSMEL